MIIVTGGAGFIGSNIVKALNKKGYTDILVVDDLTFGRKFENLVGCEFLDYMDKDDFLDAIKDDKDFAEKALAIFHQGACTDTMEWNGKYMLENNYMFSKVLLNYALRRKTPFIYASSAAIYGKGKNFHESKHNESPVNVYGYSKLLFDNYVRKILPFLESQVVGFRYFNVYGPGEQHKGNMASVIWHFNKQILVDGRVKLFAGCDGFSSGEQRRDFVFVDDVVDVNLWFWQEGQDKSGIYNVGTGKSATFNDVASEVIGWHKRGTIEYIPFPDHLRDSYQSHTEAFLQGLQSAGYKKNFKDIRVGVREYLDLLNGK